MVETRQKSVLMLPWLAHGHITPFLELAKKLTLRNLHIYFCSTPVNLNSIKKKLSHHPNNSSSSTTSIQLVELHLPSLLDLPPHHHTTKGLPLFLFPTLIKALDMTRPNLSSIIETLQPDLIIYDVFPLWVPDLASSLNIPSVAFMTSGVAFVSYMFHQFKNKDDDHDQHDFPFPEISPDYLRTKFAIFRNYPPFVDEHGRDTTPLGMYHKSCNIILVRSLRELEGKYMDYLSVSFGKKIVSVGNLVPNPINDDDDEGLDVIKWLDQKEKSSTVFVCFGSELRMSGEDMEEMAHGLELSNVNFIWVVRFQEGEKMKVEDGLPDGFFERIRDKGMVVEDWAPQIKILNHSSIGGFVSHCGWGSVLESIKFGVPIIAMPMYVDQPWNARVAEVSRIALEMKRDSINGRLQRENVAKVIRQVVVEENGEDIRRKAKEISEEIKRKGNVEIDDEVVKELLQLL